jgi:hypothetical protein
LGGRKPVAFPQKKVRHQRVMNNRLLLYTCQRKQTEYKRKKKTDKLIIFSKGPPLSSRNNFRFHMETKISRHPID